MKFNILMIVLSTLVVSINLTMLLPNENYDAEWWKVAVGVVILVWNTIAVNCKVSTLHSKGDEK